MAEKTEQKVEMKKTLSTVNIVSLSIAFIGPAAYGVGFLQIVAATTDIGPAIALAPLIGTLACIFTAVSVAVLAIKFAYSGGIYSYTRVAFGAAPAFLTGWTILLAYLLLPATGAMFIGVYMPVLTNIVGISFPFQGLIWALIFGAIMTVFAYIGIKTSAKSMTIILLVQYALIFAVAIAAIYKGISTPGTDFVAPLNPALAPGGMAAISAAGFTFFFAYYGFEATTSFAGETKNPYKSCAWGAIYAILIVGLIYILWGWALALPYTNNLPASWDVFKLAITASGDMAPVAQDLFGLAGVAVIASAIVISAFGSGTASSCSVSRILWQMGDDGLLPKKLNKLHKRFASPYVAALLTGFVTAIVPIIFFAVGYSMLQGFTFMALWCAWAVILMYMVVNLDNLVINRKESLKSAKNIALKFILPIIGFVLMAYLFYGAGIVPIAIGAWTVPVLVLGLIWEAVGIIYLLYIRQTKPDVFKLGMRGV